MVSAAMRLIRSAPLVLRLVVLRLAAIWLSALAATVAGPAAAGEPAVPPQLEPWVPWVLHPRDERPCPLHPAAPDSAGGGVPASRRVCAWPGRLQLDLGPRGGTFAQTWQVFADTWVTLPGNPETWPLDVRDGEQPLAVVPRSEAPAVHLNAGIHALSGRFAWSRLPDGLDLPAQTGLVSLVLDGSQVTFPRLDRGGRLWLADPGAAAAQDGDRLALAVYRRIDDDLPLRVTTRIELDLAGHARQIELGPVLLPGTLPLRVQSPLPARLDADGTLHVQARPGHSVLEVGARIGGAVSDLKRPAAAAPWPATEVWSFAARPDLRQVELTGAVPVDPRQAGVPADWADLPAYRLSADDTLHLAERRRGDPDPGPDLLHLERDLWPDLDGGAFSVRDRIDGQIRQGWRLSARPPLALGAIQVDGEPRLITRLTPADPPGVEVRRGRVDLIADSRLPAARGALVSIPAAGWDREFASSRAHLYLPPGWDLFAVSGTDNLPDSWIARWTLLDLFLVLIMALASARLWGWVWGLTAGLTLILTWPIPAAPHLVWINLIAAAALLRLVPEAAAGTASARLRMAVVWYRRGALAALLLVALPFVAGQVRTGLYPHLERPTVGLGTNSGPPAEARPVAAAAPERPRALRKSLAGGAAPETEAADGAFSSRTADLPAAAAPTTAPPAPPTPAGPLPEPDAVAQSGAGVPDWRWNRFELAWNGAIGPNGGPHGGAQLWLTGPRWHLLWSLAGALLTVVLGLRMAGLIGRPTAPSPQGLTPPAADSAPPAATDERTGPAPLIPSAPGDPPFSLSAADPVWPPAAAPAGAPGNASAPLSDSRPEILELPAWGTAIDTPPAVEPVTQIDPETAAPPADRPLPPLGVLVVLTALLVAGGGSPPAAAELPGRDLLNELHSRLLAPPDCLPDCVDLQQLKLHAEPGRLTLNLTLDAAVPVGTPVPGSPGGWVPTEVLLDGNAHDVLFREGDDGFLVPLPAGRHRLDLSGPLPDRAQVEVPLPLHPRSIETQLDGWALEGLDAAGSAGPQLRLLRRSAGDDVDAPAVTQGSLPPLLRVERFLRIGRDWRVETHIRRLSPAEFPVAVEVPLLPGEAVQTAGLVVQDTGVLVSLAPGETETVWNSSLEPVATLRLTAVDDPRITETWTLDLSPRWHLDWSGPAPIHRLSADRWQPTWRPLPGERLALDLTQPAAVPGQTLTIDRVDLGLQLGRRLSENTLQLDLRSTQGGLHPIRLPEGAIPTALRSGTQDLALPKPGAPIEIPLLPGHQSVQIDWRAPAAMGLLTRPALPDLGSPAVNVGISIRVPQERWVLFTGGPRIGPVVLFWGVLLVLAGLALGLGRLTTMAPAPPRFMKGAGAMVVPPPHPSPDLGEGGSERAPGATCAEPLTPLRARHWFLLGIGLSLAEVWVLVLVAGWLLALGWRRRLDGRTPRWRYNLVQVLLLILTLAAVAGLLGAVSQGLLGTPDMQIIGNGSGAGLLAWYQDRTAGPLPAVWLISVPIWVYRALMLGWALWLAMHLLDWLRWGWDGYARPVLWRGRPAAPEGR